MTKDEILSMAFEAGFGNYVYEASSLFERFAALVAEKATEEANARQNASWALMCKKMVAVEREVCAKEAESWGNHAAAAEIRARARND